jgi:hypothetical protein
MKQANLRTGFGSVRVILLVAITAVTVIGGGILVYQHHYGQSSTLNSSTTTSGISQAATQPQSSATTQSQASTTQYLDIKEWGVKFPLPSNIDDAYYVMAKGSSAGAGGVPDTAFVGTKSLTGTACNPANDDAGGTGAVGAILRLSPTDTDPVSGQPVTQKYPDGVTINGFYYAYQSRTTNNSCASQSTLQPLDSSFKTAAKNSTTDTVAQ